MYQVATDPVLEEITRVIVDGFAPERVVLFGSRARGDYRADSDYDVIVVLETPLDPVKGEVPLRAALHQRGLRVDVITYTPERFERRRDDVGAVAYVGEIEGCVLYDRNPSRWARRVRERSDPPESLADWLRRARDDFNAMHATASSVPDAYGTITYLAQQGVEKLLKAVLISRFVRPPRTHHLAELLARTPPELRDDPPVAQACASLDALWPKMRYGDDHPIPSAEETARAVADAVVVRTAVAAAFSLEAR